MKLPVYNLKAEKVSDVEVSDSLFNSDVNDKIISQYIYVYLGNQRESNAKTKDRSEVRGGGKKIIKQKGTGRARMSSIRSPLWAGGGVTHGPNGNENYKRKMTKNFKASAFRNTLSKLVKKDLVNIVEDINFDSTEKLTKKALEIKESFGNSKKVTVVAGQVKDNLINAFNNIKGSKVEFVKELNPYILINGGKILIEKSALDYLNTWSK